MRAGEGRRGIVLCIDDYGLRSGVDAAVLDLAQRGLVSAVSCMAGSPRWAQAARALRDLDPARLDVGLHLDFTESPLDRGLRRELGSFILQAYLHRLDARRVAAEIGAQFDAFEAALGRPPAHVDGHQHVHQLPIVRELLLRELARRGHSRTWLRSTRAAGGPLPLKPQVIAALGGPALRRLARRHGLRTSQRLLGVYGFQPDAALYRRLLAGWLAQAAVGDVLMCHPALDDAESGADPIAAARRMEYGVLVQDLPRLLDEHGCRLGPLAG